METEKQGQREKKPFRYKNKGTERDEAHRENTQQQETVRDEGPGCLPGLWTLGHSFHHASFCTAPESGWEESGLRWKKTHWNAWRRRRVDYATATLCRLRAHSVRLLQEMNGKSCCEEDLPHFWGCIFYSSLKNSIYFSISDLQFGRRFSFAQSGCKRKPKPVRAWTLRFKPVGTSLFWSP